MLDAIDMSELKKLGMLRIGDDLYRVVGSHMKSKREPNY